MDDSLKGVDEMEEIRKRLIHLHHCRGIGWKTMEKFFQYDPTFTKIYSLTPSEISSQFFIPLKISSLIYHDLHHLNIDQIIKNYEKRQIHLITRFDDVYPERLQHIYQPPWVLYAKGKIDLLQNDKMIAVVGTRKPTSYGKEVTEYFVKELTSHGYIIVSGLARGIDIKAHEEAVKNKGQTIAILGSGINHIYPQEFSQFAHQLTKNHLLLSEYPPDTSPAKHHFPQRNRIISGISMGTVVIEAKEKSGSLITARFALEHGREVFAVPGPITSEMSKGTHQLIQEGAKLVQKIEDIFDEFFYFQAYDWNKKIN